jgi:Putative Actinobacterial Holin-X, holin superfamily III
MNRLINRLVSEATAPIGEMSMRLFKMAMLFFLAMSCLIASAIFLTIGFFEFLEPLEGYTGAAVGVGGLYLVAALICMLVIARERPASPRQASAALKPKSHYHRKKLSSRTISMRPSRPFSTS